MQAIVFLDRDGTINIDFGYVTSPNRVELIPGAADAIARIKNAGLTVVVVSNQSAVGRGMATLADIEATNSEVSSQLLSANNQAVLDQILFSTASPTDIDETRKPGIGLVKNLEYARNSSWVVGDKLSDIEFGINAGLPNQNCILVLTGEGAKYKDRVPNGAKVVKDLLEAAAVILKAQ